MFPDGRRVVSCCDGKYSFARGELKVWDMATGKCVATLKGHSGVVRRAASTVLL